MAAGRRCRWAGRGIRRLTGRRLVQASGSRLPNGLCSIYWPPQRSHSHQVTRFVSDSREAAPLSMQETEGPAENGTGSVGDEEFRRLPPPAFPPGHRRGWVHRPKSSRDSTSEEARGEIPDDAFFAPEGPIRRSRPDPEAVGEAAATGSAPRDPGTSSSPSRDEVALLLEGLARELRSQREGRLPFRTGAPALELALRGLISGFLRHPASRDD
jgi:hypothetical protein